MEYLQEMTMSEVCISNSYILSSNVLYSTPVLAGYLSRPEGYGGGVWRGGGAPTPPSYATVDLLTC